jgi:drug/metabolite transporter (DMT)-like permease
MAASAGVSPAVPATMPKSTSRDRLVGIALMCGALACFTGLDTSAKWLGRQGLDPVLVAWARYAVAVVLASIFVNPWTTPGVSRTRRPLLQVGRSALLLLSTILNLFALRYLQLAETMSIQFATPLLVALIAGPVLGEWLDRKRLAAVGIGFLGVIVITRPGFGGMHPAALLSLAATVCYAVYNVATRVLAAYDSSSTTLFYSGLAGVVLVTPLLPWVWATPSSGLVWALLAGVGFFGALGHWLLILAHARAPAPILAPFMYTQLLWMLSAGYLVFGDVPNRWTLAGAMIVVASGGYLLSRERLRRR